MTADNFHTDNQTNNPPPSNFNLSILQKLSTGYKLWHEFLPHFPKDTRYTLGNKIDSLFLETIENTIKAEYSSKAEKEIFLKRSSVNLDLLKFFLKMSWEIESINMKRYIRLSEKLDEIGKMLGGWLKSVK